MRLTIAGVGSFRLAGWPTWLAALLPVAFVTCTPVPFLETSGNLPDLLAGSPGAIELKS